MALSWPFVSAARFDDVQRLLGLQIGERDRQIAELKKELEQAKAQAVADRVEAKRREDVLNDLIYFHQFGEAPFGTRPMATVEEEEPELDPNSIAARTAAVEEHARQESGAEELASLILRGRTSDLGPAISRLKHRQFEESMGLRGPAVPAVQAVFAAAREEVAKQ